MSDPNLRHRLASVLARGLGEDMAWQILDGSPPTRTTMLP
jgi:hypothetical protein